MSLEPGIRGQVETLVVHENSAVAVGSGDIEVFATPCMIADMECASLQAVKPYLEEGQATVGIQVNVEHKASTPVGMTVRTESELVECKGKILVFQVRSYAGDELIGEGTHTRCIVNQDRFLQKALAKKG